MRELGTVERGDKRTILVVDDAQETVMLLSSVLSDEYRVLGATDGERALQLARGVPAPDLILLDVVMPGMDGLEVCRRLKDDPATSKIPVIFVTSRDEASEEAAGFAAGAADYVTKPVNTRLLRARVHAHVQLRAIREELERTNEELRENIRLRAEVEAINRHDLKSPLSVIINVPAMMLQDPSISDRNRHLAGIIKEAGERMLEMINRTIDTYKMERGIYRLRRSLVDVLPIFRQIAGTLSEALRQKRISIELTIDGRMPAEGESFLLLGEELLYYTLFANLLKNAVEAAPENGAVTIGARSGGRALVSIHNPGAIPEPIRERFFEKYATSGKAGGTGLGAYSARLIARTLGGTLECETSDSSGTTITFEIDGPS